MSATSPAGRLIRARVPYPAIVAATAALVSGWTIALTPAAFDLQAGAGPFPETGFLPSLLLVRRLSDVLAAASPASASLLMAGLAIAALAAALFVWARRFDAARGGASLLLLAILLPVLSMPTVASAIARHPQLAVSFLAGTLVLAVLDRQMHRPSDIGLFAAALSLLLAWAVDDLFWASLPGCVLFLLARSPEAIRKRSLAALAVIVLFPVLAALAGLTFLASIYVYPETGIALATGFETLEGAAARLGLDAPTVLPAILVAMLGLNFALAAVAPKKLPGAFAAAALPFSACTIGMAVAGADGLLAAVPMIALSMLETFRILATQETGSTFSAEAVPSGLEQAL